MAQKILNILYSRNSLVLIILTIAFLPLFIAFGGFYIYGDATSQMLPFLYETKRMFASGLPLWSWNTYAGQDFLFSYAYYTTTNPFVWINCLFPYSMLGFGFTVTIYLKVLVCAYVAQLYFRKMGFGRELSLVGSLLYTFSSWGVTALFYYMFIDPMILFPLMFIAIERFLRGEKHRYTGIVAVTFLTVWINYYFTPGTLIAASIYFFCRLFSQTQWRERWLRLSFQALGCVVLGIALAACILVPVYYILHDSPRGVSTLHIDWFSQPDRLLSVLFPKISEGLSPFILISSFYNINAAYVVVFGVLCAFLMILKKKSYWCNWLFVIYIILYITPANGLFALFTSVDYSRWAYALVLSIVLCTLYYIKDYGLPRKKAAVIFIIVALILYALIGGASGLWYIKHDMQSSAVFRLLIFETLLVLLNLVCLYFLSRPYGCDINQHKHRLLTACIAICAAAQLSGFCLWSARTGPFEIGKMSISPKFTFEGECSNNDFTERSYFEDTEQNRGFANRGLMVGIPTTQAFHSMRNGKIFTLTAYVDTTNGRYQSFSPSVFKESYCALMSLRRCLSARILKGVPEVEKSPELPYYIPMGMAYDTYQLDDSIGAIVKGKPTQDLPLAMLGAIAIKADDEADFAMFLKKAEYTSDLSLDSVVEVRRQTTADHVKGDTRGLSAHIVLDEPQAVFFSFPAEEGFTATVDGKPTKIYSVNLGMTAILLEAGDHNIRFEYFPAGLTAGIWISICALALTFLLFLAEKRATEDKEEFQLKLLKRKSNDKI